MTFKPTRTFAWIAGAAGVSAIGWLLMPDAIDVDVAALRSGPMQVTIDDIGEARSRERFVVSSPVTGRIDRIDLRDGDAVAAGQPLARIAPMPLSRRERDELIARVAAAEAVRREAQAHVQRAQTERAQAERERARLEKLAADGFVSPQALEQARRAAAAAASEAAAAAFRERAATADVAVVRAGLAALGAESSGPDARIEIRAPVDGRVLRIVDRSERVVAAGTPLMTLGDLATLEVVVEMLSSDAVRVAPGMPVLVEGWGGDQTLRATVARVEPYAVTKVSALGIEEKRVNVIATFDEPPARIGDGYRVTARVVAWQSSEVRKLPTSALFRCGAEWCVFAIEAGTARQRRIAVGQRNAAEVEVLDGLEVGGTVVRFPTNDLADGVRVRARTHVSR